MKSKKEKKNKITHGDIFDPLFLKSDKFKIEISENKTTPVSFGGPGFSFEIPIIEGEHTYEAKRNGDTVEYFIDGKKVNSESK